MKNLKTNAAICAALLLLAASAQAAEYPIGAEIERNNLKIKPNYLTGIEMSRMPEAMPMGPDVIHLEADIHAAKNEPHGFAENEWLPYLTISYIVEKTGGGFKKTGHLFAMTAADGPHYANNIALAGPGEYRLTYHIEPPPTNGFIRHTDKATGVPDWWKPFDLAWTFTYPAK